MKRICFLVGNLNNSGGTERVTSLIANELVKENFSISILNLEDGGNPFFKLDDRISVDSLYSKKVSYKMYFIPTLWKIRNYVLKNKIDTLIVVDSISCVLTVPALFGLKIKHICWEHFNFNTNVGLKFRDLGRQWAAKYCDYVVTLTKRDKELWEKGLDRIKAKIVAIPNPVPFENIDNIPKLEYKTILSVGRYTYQKGFDMLIDAWALACKDNAEWMLRIVGSGEDEDQLKDQAKKLGIFDRIEFIAPTKNIEQYYKTSSFYCMSSRFEGLPMVLLEAQSFGLPLIAYDCDTGPSDIIKNDVNGFLIKAYNIEEYKESMLSLIMLNDEKYHKMVTSSKKNMEDFLIKKVKFCWMSLFESYE